MLNKLWLCNECTIGKCFQQSEKSAISENGHIAKICQHRCGGKANYKPTVKYQIIEVPDPVYYLDIPKQLQDTVSEYLWEYNGKTIDHIVTPTSARFTGIQIDRNQWEVDRTWIKQKQPEPTRKELQERIDAMLKHSDRCILGRFSQDLHDGLCKIANGEK